MRRRGPGAGAAGTFLPTMAAAPSYSIYFGGGIRQLAGWSLILNDSTYREQKVESDLGRAFEDHADCTAFQAVPPLRASMLGATT